MSKEQKEHTRSVDKAFTSDNPKALGKIMQWGILLSKQLRLEIGNGPR